MIDINMMNAALVDLVGGQEEGQAGWDMNDIQMRFEMLGVDFEDFQMFLLGRLSSADGDDVEGIEWKGLEWVKGYTHAALEFFLYGIVVGKEEILNKEINEN